MSLLRLSVSVLVALSCGMGQAAGEADDPQHTTPATGGGRYTKTENALARADSARAEALGSLQLPTASRREVPFDGYSPVAELMVEKLLQSLRQVSTYSDGAVVQTVTELPDDARDLVYAESARAVALGSPGNSARSEPPAASASFAYVRPARFGIKTKAYAVYGDGRDLTVHAKRLRQYTAVRVEKDIPRQIARHCASIRLPLSVASLLLSPEPRKQFAEQFRNLDLVGRDVVQDDRCYVLAGTTETSARGLKSAVVPVTLWLRESDSMIRRIELDLLDALKDRFGDDHMVLSVEAYKLVYDVRDLRINEPVPERAIVFEPSATDDKVARFDTAGGASDEITEDLEVVAGDPSSDVSTASDDRIVEPRGPPPTADRADRGSAPLASAHEDSLEQAWFLRARGSRSFAVGAGSSVYPGGDLWIRDAEVVRRVSPEGKVSAELRIARPSSDPLGRDTFVTGRIGPRWGVVYMAPILDEEDSTGFSPPRGVVFTASDESGEPLWEIELEVTGRRLPRHVTLADVDGRVGDELLFVHDGALWIIDGRGEVLAKKPITGFSQWLLVDDRDRDGRPEVYLRTRHKLQRFDYRPN